MGAGFVAFHVWEEGQMAFWVMICWGGSLRKIIRGLLLLFVLAVRRQREASRCEGNDGDGATNDANLTLGLCAALACLGFNTHQRSLDFFDGATGEILVEFFNDPARDFLVIVLTKLTQRSRGRDNYE